MSPMKIGSQIEYFRAVKLFQCALSTVEPNDSPGSEPSTIGAYCTSDVTSRIVSPSNRLSDRASISRGDPPVISHAAR